MSEDEINIEPIITHFTENPMIKVIGVGGGGCNAVNNMYEMGIIGVEYYVCNTDIQDLHKSSVKNRIQIGKELTEGLGAGAHPEKGRDALMETEKYIKDILAHNTEVVFITAGMGGGTGTGAAPEIARLAHKMGILTIGVVSVPFSFEGRSKTEQAIAGIDELEKFLDAIIIVINDKILEAPKKLSEAFALADDILSISVRSIAEIITLPGKVSIDLRDIYSIMRNSGITLIGAGEAEGEDRADLALKKALDSPLLKYHDIRGASNILLHLLYGDKEFKIGERDYIVDEITSKVGDYPNVIWGDSRIKSLGDKLRIVVIATGFNGTGTRVEPNESGEVDNKKGVFEDQSEIIQKPDFYVESPDDDYELELEIESAAEIEEKSRRRKVREVREGNEADKIKERYNKIDAKVRDIDKKERIKNVNKHRKNKNTSDETTQWLGKKFNDRRFIDTVVKGKGVDEMDAPM